jgi:hypothetical protein
MDACWSILEISLERSVVAEVGQGALERVRREP